MPTISLTESLRKEYGRLFGECEIRLEKLSAVEAINKKIMANKSRYENVASPLGIPWFFIAAVHNMESSLSYDCHLHNGDPLTGRTTNFPTGRPASGNPPFTWEESARDSLTFQKLNQWTDWSLPGLLYKLEGYNGWGYRLNHPEVLSPYLWSGSNHYAKGKYISDGRWSDSAVSAQIGAAVILRRLAEEKFIVLEAPVAPNAKKPLIYYSNKKEDHAEELQRYLNGFLGIYVLVDGIPGKKTSEALKIVTGNYLDGDPRG